MELFLIRHGQSTNNALSDWNQRVEDPLLTAEGEQQAGHLAVHVAAGRHIAEPPRDAARPVLDQLYCSAMIRAIQTADAIAKAVGVVPHVWVDIHEHGGIYRDHGERKIGYPGATRRELSQRFPQCVLAPEVTEQGWWNRDFEELHVGHGRAARVAQALRERAAEDVRIGIVTHGDFMSTLLNALGGQPLGAGIYYEHGNTGVTCVEITPDGARLRYLNRVDHLPAEPDI